MDKFKGFHIEKVSPASITDPRGSTRQLQFNNGNQPYQITALVRKANATSGPHVHTGIDPAKDPETLYIAQGGAILTSRTPDGEIHEELVEEGDLITIRPGIPHRLEFIEKQNVVLELRTTLFDPEEPDTDNAQL